jgi:small nuclear ribonucleoprotein (snRNP)-like protein
MAAPEQSLDIYSPHFDPVAALHSRLLSVPYPNVVPLNNLAECRRFLPPDAPNALPRAAAVLAAGSAPEQVVPSGALRGEKARASATTERKAPAKLGPITEGVDRFSQGPLKVVKQLIRKRVCVVTRHRNCVRGTCTGILIAADRHLNLLLLDAEETFMPAHEAARLLSASDDQTASNALLARAVRSRPPTTLPPTAQTQELQPVRQRYGQLLLRGEGIVLIYAAP